MNITEHHRPCATLFVTGTDTGVGKTVLTAMLLAHARARGLRALALKPFCTGGRGDAELLWALQGGELPLDVVNPWWSRVALTPAVALRQRRKKPNKQGVLAHVRAVQAEAELLLIEGAGGLLSPLGGDYAAADLIGDLGCAVVVVARNRLGCLNHILMTCEILKQRGAGAPVVVLREEARPDGAARSNRHFLQKTGHFAGFYRLPWLGAGAAGQGGVKKNEKKMKKTLAEILGFAKTRAALCKTVAGESRSTVAEKK